MTFFNCSTKFDPRHPVRHFGLLVLRGLADLVGANSMARSFLYSKARSKSLAAPGVQLPTAQNRLAVSCILALVFLGSAVIAPKAEAACPGSGFTPTGFVNLVSCTETKVGSNEQAITIAVPASTASGNLLITVIATDGEEDFSAPAGWLEIAGANIGNDDGTLAVFKRTAGASEPANYTFTWSSGEQAIGYMMRFTGTNSSTLVSVDAANGGIATAPTLQTLVPNTLILRIFGHDDDDFAPPSDNSVVAGYETITEDESNSSGGATVSSSAAFINQAAVANVPTAAFAGGGNEQWAAVTLGIQPGAAAAPTPLVNSIYSCPGIDGPIVGSQLVVHEQCTSFQGGNDATNVDIPAPSSAQIGNYMIAVISSDGDRIPFNSVPAGWTALSQSEIGAVTQAIFGKFYTATEPATYSWALSGGEQRYGYIMLFSGASGLTVPTVPAVNSGIGLSSVSPAVVTARDNTLILRISSSDDDDVVVNPERIISGFNNVTSNSSSLGGNAISSQAAYANQVSASNTGTATFFQKGFDEQWVSTAIGIEPYEFRFSMPDTTASTCAVQQVTLRVTDRLGNAVTNFTGSVDLSITTTLAAHAVGAQWLDLDASLNGTLGASTNGAATYTFDSDDNGVAVFDFHSPNATTVNFNLVHDDNGPTFTESGSFDPSLVVNNNCSFSISHDGAASTCSAESITFTLVDSENNRATIYDNETINISLNSGSGGNFSLNTGSGTLTPNPDNDNNGAVSYTFVAADNAQVILNYSNSVAQTVNFDAVDPTNGFLADLSPASSFDPNLVLTPCEVRIDILDASNESDVCSVAQITFSVTDASGNLVTNYIGTLNISTSSGQGNWSGGETNTVANLIAADGIATYSMVAADGGNVTLNFTHASVDAAVNFNVSSTSPNGALLNDSTAVGQDPNLDVQGCEIDIQVTDGLADVCAAAEQVTYRIRDRNGATAADYTGVIVLNTDVGRGNYTPVGENGTFVNGTIDDGIANYTFNTLDNGVLTVDYSDDVAGTVNLTASGAGLSLDSGSDVDIQFSACEFRISFVDATPGAMDVCSIETVRIALFTASGSPVTNYTGTINLSTSTGNGTWVDPAGVNDGTLIDPFGGDGNASYTFDAADNGTIDLQFSDLNNETVNINVSDGTSTDPADSMDPNDPNISVALCTFQISFDGGGLTSVHDDTVFVGCSVQQVTIEIYNSAGALDVDYTGTVSLSTSTDNGNWLIGSGLGTLIDTDGDDDGAATYTFADTDNGLATLEFVNINGETLNINVADGVIIETGAEDPNLTVQSCVAALGPQSCVQSTTTSITIGAEKAVAAQRGRMVLMVIMHEGTTPVTASPTVAGQSMTLVRQQINNTDATGNSLEVWGILDADLPDGGGSVTGVFAGPPNGPVMCMFSLTDVAQEFPQPNLVSPTDGPINGTQGTNPGAFSGRQVAVTGITPQANNSLVMSFVSNGDSGTYTDVEPDPPLTRLFNGPEASGGTTFSGSSGTVILASETIVQETWSGASNPRRDNHIVVAFAPLVTGPPVAEGFVPVTLFQTYAGNISYRVVGNSLRTTRNLPGNNVTQGCVFGNGDGPISATLNLPDETVPAGFDSTVLAAYLYWFGHGEFDNQPPGADFDDVTFITPTSPPGGVNISADEVYLIEGVGGGGGLDYYAAYKDVTGLVSSNGLYSVDNIDVDLRGLGAGGAPGTNDWAITSACAGGFALAVVYENPFEQLRVINLFQGFQPFQNSAFGLVPRNFRMANQDADRRLPNGQITHITVEGDETLSDGVESLEIQDAPSSINYSPLITIYNPAQAEFNSTVTYPVYALTDVDPSAAEELVYLFNETLTDIPNFIRNGYKIDFPGPDYAVATPTDTDEIGNTPGVDIDTHYLTGDGRGGSGDIWAPFAAVDAEEITTRYSAGQDLVLLVGELISVTNAPIADLEVTKTEVGAFKVGGTGQYQFSVKNNGNGAASFGFANGVATVTDRLPNGMTFAAAGDVSGDGWVCSVTLSPGAFTCNFNITNDWTLARGAQTAGRLGESATAGVGEVLPVLTATVQIGGSAFFPLLNNNAKNTVRLLQSDGTCAAAAVGVSPTPVIACFAAQFDNVNDLQGGILDINDLENKRTNNNNLDSITTVVQGIRTNLGIDKTAVGVFEDGSSAGQYRIRVTNFGPDATTANFTVTDPQPARVIFNSVVADADWNCATITPTLSCQYVGPSLLVNGFKDLLLNVTENGNAGQNITNTVSVAAGPFNFDTIPGNNSDTDITTIQAPPAAGSEKFLLSVSSSSTTGATIGGLTFENNDLIIYDPISDTAVSFFDNSALGYSVDDPNAVHLLPNGQVILSANGNSTIGSNNLAFQPNDLVKFDPITNLAEIFFNGDDYPETTGANIDAVYVLDNGDIVFSTAADVGTGIGWSDSDLVLFNGSTFSIYLNAEDSDVFGAGAANVDALYIKVDPTDATAVIDTFDLSSDNEGTLISDDNVVFGRDDVVEFTIDTTDGSGEPDATSAENLFFGNLATGIFTANDANRRLNALHTLQTGYLGLFAITQSQGGSACEAGKVTISKLQGLTANVDTDYFGSIRLTTSTNTGTWVLDSGSGTLVDTVANDGQATYTFVAADNGTVTLSLSVEIATALVDINVTNGIVSEGTVDDALSFNEVVTTVSYIDRFEVAAFNVNDGASWANSWQEIDDANGVSGANSGAGVAAGNIRISGGRLSLTTNASTAATGRQPSLSRRVDLSSYNVTEQVFLDFAYTYSSVNTADSIVVEVSDDSGSNWTAFPAYTGFSGTKTASTTQSLNVSTLGGTIDDFTNSLDIRFRVANGYILAAQFNVLSVELRTGSTDCNAGSAFDHYEIRIGGVTGSASTLVNGISCLRSEILVSGHNGGDVLTAPNEMITLRAFDELGISRGSWAKAPSALGVFVESGTLTDGTATYTFPLNATQALFYYNYTNPVLSNDAFEDINFNVVGSVPVDSQEDPTLRMSPVIIKFTNESDATSDNIPNQISGKSSNVAPNSSTLTMQVLTTSETNPSVCAPFVAPGQTFNFSFALECIDANTCNSGSLSNPATLNGTPIANVNSNSAANASAYTNDVALTFGTEAGKTAAPIVLNYQDAGNVQLHASFDIPLSLDPSNIAARPAGAGTPLFASSNVFTVRPFGFDIDFSDDRSSNLPNGLNSYALDGNGTAFAVAGIGFDTTVTAVQYQAADDTNADGIPDDGAVLADNLTTPNFGNDSTRGNYKVGISSVTVAPPGGFGTLSNTDFNGNGFVNGSQTHTMTFDEAGIIDLSAQLQALGGASTNYLSWGTSIFGSVDNVGRFYAASIELEPAAIPIVSRPLAKLQTMCIMPSNDFTYLGEDFAIAGVLEAQNANGARLLNYVDGFTKLDNAALTGAFAAFVQEVGPDTNLSSRLAASSVSAPAITWPGNGAAQATRGRGVLSGQLKFNRQASGAEDGPFPALSIGISAQDSDTAAIELGIDLDEVLPIANDTALIGSEAFRYGRLLVENAYGPEEEPLDIPLQIQYWNGSGFVLNSLDSCTTLFYDATSANALDRSVRFLTAAGSYEEELSDGDSVIEPASVGVADVSVSILNGKTGFVSSVDADMDSQADDRPFSASPAGLGNEGSVVVEFNLTDPQLPYSLEFLSYDWRTAGELENDTMDGIYSDNPRSRLEFGSYRGHDRVINWQEIYIGPASGTP